MTSIFPHVAGGRRKKENTVYAMLFDKGWTLARYERALIRSPDYDNIGPRDSNDIIEAIRELRSPNEVGRSPSPDLRIDTRTRRTLPPQASSSRLDSIGPPINLGRGSANIPFVPRDVRLVPRRTSSYSVASTSASVTIDTNIEVPKKSGKGAAIKRLIPKNIFKK